VGAPVAAGVVAQEEEAATQGLHTQKHGPDQRPGDTSAGRGAGMAGKEKATAGKKGCDAAHVVIGLAAQSATVFIPTQPYLEDSLWHCWW
jgi:hypothetical protein